MAAVIEKARGRAHAVDCSIAQRALTVQGLSYDNRFAQFPNQHCVFAFVFSRSWFLHFILKLTISPVSIFPPFSVHPWLFSLSHIYHSGFFFFFLHFYPFRLTLMSHTFLPSLTPYFSPFSHCFSPLLAPAGGMRCILCVQTCRARSSHATKRMLERPLTAPT